MERNKGSSLVAVWSIILLFGCFDCSALSFTELCKWYYTNGGQTTILVGHHIRESKRVDKGSFHEPSGAILGTDGNIYVQAYGKLASEDAERVHVLILPLADVSEKARKYYEKHQKFMGVYNLQRNQISADTEIESSISKSGIELPVTRSSQDKSVLAQIEFTPQLAFRAPSMFTYAQEEPIWGDDGSYLFFRAAPVSYRKKWLSIFYPITYAFDVITSPVQIPFFYFVNKLE